MALFAQIPVDVRILHGTVDAGRPDARERHRPHADFPVAHVHGDNEGRAHLVLVAADPMAVGHVQPARVLDDAVDIHRLDHYPAEIVPGGNGDPLALFGCLVGKGPFQIGERALVAPVALAEMPPEEGRDIAGRIQRNQADHADQKPECPIFEAVFQIGREGRVG